MNLKIWTQSHKLVLNIYKLTSTFPNSEKYGLASQMQRAAVCIPSNIAEGKGREGDKEFKRFLYIARGSLEELKYQLLLSKDLGYISLDVYEQIIDQTNIIGKMLNCLINKLKSC